MYLYSFFVLIKYSVRWLTTQSFGSLLYIWKQKGAICFVGLVCLVRDIIGITTLLSSIFISKTLLWMVRAEFAKLRAFRALRAFVPQITTSLRAYEAHALNYHLPTCLRALNYYVSTCLRLLNYYVPKCLCALIFHEPPCLRTSIYIFSCLRAFVT